MEIPKIYFHLIKTNLSFFPLKMSVLQFRPVRPVLPVLLVLSLVVMVTSATPVFDNSTEGADPVQVCSIQMWNNGCSQTVLCCSGCCSKDQWCGLGTDYCSATCRSTCRSTGWNFPTDAADKATLLAFYGNLTSRGSLSWNTNTEVMCGQPGIECDTYAKVDRLDLGSFALQGTINTVLTQLSHLTRLSLASNALTGTIPSELALLSRLKVLRLEHNWMTGNIPKELDILPLSELYLAGNSFSCPIPDYTTWAASNDYASATCIPEVDSCPAVDVDGTTFPTALVGETVEGRCPAGTLGIVTMTCVCGGVWSKPYVCTPCKPFEEN